MSDLRCYIKKRKASDKVFAQNYDKKYIDFKINIILKNLREEANITQEELAKKMHTKKSAISRIETKSADLRLSTLFKFAAVLGRKVRISII